MSAGDGLRLAVPLRDNTQAAGTILNRGLTYKETRSCVRVR
jgi:hypothetical protein